MSEFAYPLGGKQDYTSAQAGAFHGTRTSGVWSGEDNLKVTITGARQLTLSKGIAWFTTEEYWGKVYGNTADINFTLPVADAVLDRICRLVIRWDKTANTATAQLLMGDLGSSPTAPARSKTDELYDLVLCDYLIAHEFLLKRDNPDFKKSQRDDLHSMEIGLLGFKGRVHFQISPCINDELDKLSAIDEKSELLANILKVIDKAIHTNYKIYPGNYIAYDILDGQKRFADRYTNKDQTTFANYLNSQLAKIPDVTSKDKDFLKERILSMYANPLKNQLIALGQEA